MIAGETEHGVAMAKHERMKETTDKIRGSEGTV